MKMYIFELTTFIQKKKQEDLEVLYVCNTRRPTSSQNIPYLTVFNIFAGYRLLTGAILAHELMHGWLRLKGRMP